MRDALSRNPGKPIELRDDESNRTYLLVDREQAREFLEQWIVQELVEAEADIAHGRVVAWNPSGILSQVRSRAVQDRPE